MTSHRLMRRVRATVNPYRICYNSKMESEAAPMRSPDASVIILYNEEGKMLLEHRADTRKRWPSVWALFGGRPDEGETPEETVRREAKEELGYTLSNPVLIFTQTLPKKEGKKFVFVEKYDDVQKIVLLPHESQGYGWFSYEETLEIECIPHDREFH